jgi:hypothetical protein
MADVDGASAALRRRALLSTRRHAQTKMATPPAPGPLPDPAPAVIAPLLSGTPVGAVGVAGIGGLNGEVGRSPAL